ncbi:hypothetical protein ES705_16794 [subsurface metagenome]
MISRKKKKKNKFEGQFAGVEFKIMESEAFKDIRVHGKWLYIEFKHRFYGDNRKNIIFTYQEARKIMSESAFIKGRNQLIERGFIDVIKRGGLEKQPNIYGISDRWKKFGTKDFIKIDIKKIFPRIFKKRFKKGHKFMGKRFKKKEHL